MWRGPDRGQGAGDQPLPGPRPPGRPHVRLLPPGRRLPAPRHGRAAALRRRPLGRWRCRSERRPRSRTGTCSRSASRDRSSGSGSPGGARTTRAARPRARRSSTRSRELLAPAAAGRIEERDEAIAAEAGGRGLAESVFCAGCGAERERARPGRGGRRHRRPENEPAAARSTQLEPVLERMREIELFGPSTLEEYAVCPYRWFVDHELKPQRIGPEEEPLTTGSVAHQVLEALYEDPPGPERAADAGDRWTLARAGPGAGRRGRGRSGCPAERPDTAAALRRVEGLVLAFLADEAATANAVRAAHAEASLRLRGLREGPRSRLPEGGVHGQIDRIDLGPARRGAGPGLQVRRQGRGRQAGCSRSAASSSSSSTCSPPASSGDIDLAGGLYRPLGGDQQPPAQGAAAEGAGRGAGGRSTHARSDQLDDEAFEARARTTPGTKPRRSSPGSTRAKSARDPLGGSCPDYCTFQPICRRERGLPEEEPWSDEGEEE